MIRSALTVAALAAFSTSMAYAGDLGCTAGIGYTAGNLLGQAGVFTTKAAVAAPSVDCSLPNGLFVQGFGYFAMPDSWHSSRDVWHNEVDGLVGWRGQSGAFDYGIRAGDYNINSATGMINVADQRAWAGYTATFAPDFNVRLYGIVDNQYGWQGVGFAGKDTFGFAAGATANWKLLDTVTFSTTVESWYFPAPGFFATGRPNFKVVPALDFALDKSTDLVLSYTAMWGNQFDPTDHAWKGMPSVGINHKF